MQSIANYALKYLRVFVVFTICCIGEFISFRLTLLKFPNFFFFFFFLWRANLKKIGVQKNNMIRLFVDHRNDTVNAKDVGISHIQNFTNNNVARFASLNQLIEKERLKKTIGNLELQQSTISTTTTTTTTNSTPTLQTPGTSNSLFSPNQQILQTNTNTNTTISSNTHNTHHQNHHHHHNINLNNPSSVFKILLPVDPIQRKTYEVKTRYITPNPVIIHQDPETISSIPILRGSVRVDLVEEDGRISAKLSSLLSCDAGLEIPLDENQKAMFALKVKEKQKRNELKFRKLIFSFLKKGS